MGILKQINYLAEKLTGTNPKKKEINQSIKYIADNYSGNGNGTSSDLFLIDITFSDNYATATLNTPYEDIIEAYQNNKILMVSGLGLMPYSVGMDGGIGSLFIEFIRPYRKDSNGGIPGTINLIGWDSIYIREDGITLYYSDYEEPED